MITIFLFDYNFNNAQNIKNYYWIVNTFLGINNQISSQNISFPLGIELEETKRAKISTIIDMNALHNQSLNNQLRNYIANIDTLNMAFDQAGANMNGDGWEYYFNVGNLKLLQGYSYLSGEDKNKNIQSYALLKESMVNYDQSLDMLLTGSEYYKTILNNKAAANSVKHLAGVKGILIIVKEFLNKFGDIDKKVDILNEILTQEEQLLKELFAQFKDEDAIKCLQKINKDLNQSIISSKTIKDLVKFYVEGLYKKLNIALEKPDEIMSNPDNFIQPVESSIQKVSTSLDGYLKQTQSIKSVLETKNQEIIKFLCDANNPGNQTINDINKELNKGLNELNKMLGDKVNQNQSQEQQQEQQQDQTQTQPNNTQPNHQQIPQGYEQQMMDSIKKENDNWIKQMQDLKRDPGYTPKNYLDQLFKEFLGSDKDFTNYTGGELEKFDNNR